MRQIDLSPTPDEAYAALAAREAAYLRANPPQPVHVERGLWLPACGGTETPFKSRTGRTLLYCWNAYERRHAYVDCGTDMVLSDDEARAALQMD